MKLSIYIIIVIVGIISVLANLYMVYISGEMSLSIAITISYNQLFALGSVFFAHMFLVKFDTHYNKDID